MATTSIGSTQSSGHMSQAKVVFLTNFLPPYRVAQMEQLAQLLPNLQILISTPTEKNRHWKPNWGDLKVEVQKNLTLTQTWKHPSGFSEPLYVHIPYDTLPTLYRHRPDVVLSGELGFRSLLAALYRRLQPKSRLILWATLSESTEQGRGYLRTLMRRWLAKQADAIIVNGKSGERYMRSLGAKGPIFHIPYSTDVEAMKKCAQGRTFPESPQHLLYLGQLTPRKGLMEFAEVLNRWGQSNPQRSIRFTLLGEGELKPALQAYPWQANINVQFLPQIPYEDLHKAYAMADILVFPTLADEWGMVAGEALAAGLPVFGSVYSQAVDELVKDGENGWRVHPDRPQQMYAALEEALAVSRSELWAMSHNATQSAYTISHAYIANAIFSAIAKVSLGLMATT